MMKAHGPVYLSKNQVCQVDTQDAGIHSFPSSVQEMLSNIERVVGIKEQGGQIEGTISSAGAFPIDNTAHLIMLNENVGRIEVEMHHNIGFKLLIPVRQHNSLHYV